jgi:hypothetical protein
MEDKMKAFWEHKFYPRLRELVDDESASTSKLALYATYVYWAGKANLDLKFSLSEEEDRLLNSVQDFKMYHMHLAHQQLASLSNYKFFKQFNEFVQVVKQGATWHDSPYFS